MKQFFKTLIAYFRIPRGIYCYKINSIDISKDGLSIKRKNCPYWEMRNDKPTQMNGYCDYLKCGDWEGPGIGFLWDRVKECGIKEGSDDKDIE